MSLTVSKIVNFPQAVRNFLVEDEHGEPIRGQTTTGGVLYDTDFAWLACGPRLEVANLKTGSKVGSWIFGWVLKDFETKIVCVDAIQRPHGRTPLLAVAINSTFSGGMVCVFDFVTSKVTRAIQIGVEITNLHVVDAGYDVFVNLPGPLRNFDGIIAVGTAGGEVYLVDVCRQMCDEALTTAGLKEIRDELNPCQLNLISAKDGAETELHKEYAVNNGLHLAIHLNAVHDKSNKHFALKGPKGEDRLFVNREEVTVSALCYCPQLGSLLVGYNFGAFQLHNLMNLSLVYTSTVCEEHIPISHFTVQEPADDPRAFCYVWAVYSSRKEQYPSCLPLAVLYAFSYLTKEYYEGYGFLYQDLQYAAIQYQMELNRSEDSRQSTRRRRDHSHSTTNMMPRKGTCIHLSSIRHGSGGQHPGSHGSGSSSGRESGGGGAANIAAPQSVSSNSDDGSSQTALCIIAWSVDYNDDEDDDEDESSDFSSSDTFVCVFDINQWYKEQMPREPNKKFNSTYMMQFCLSDLLGTATNTDEPVLDIRLNRNTLQQFVGTQRLEEHFCPNSLSFSLCSLRPCDVVFIQHQGVQKALLIRIESEGPLCLVEPAEIYQQVIALGLVPLFIDIHLNALVTTNQQREIILGTALENRLLSWLCKCASDFANGSFLAVGCSLEFLLNWAFHRATVLKTSCDKLCIPLFDYSGVKLDSNTNTLLNNCTRQLQNICSFYSFALKRLPRYIHDLGVTNVQHASLQMVSAYFEVLQWLLNVGLLPECPLSEYPRADDQDRPFAPYPSEFLTDFYNHRRAVMKTRNQENFQSSDSILFIDNLIDRECGGQDLQKQWKNDGGNGLYPPPSLQALLRTYLIENVHISFKHSIVIYVFLDLAMVLEEERYKPVITHLIKFPAVFKVAPSIIKLTQAFWQLDHGDYNSAMGLLLDPLIAAEDLKSWHHKVALRSLLLQEQSSLALLYIQIRKPTIRDDDDILTAISLYVANNMLDEAFYFEEHFNRYGDKDKYLAHLFNEINKNDKLRLVIYRVLTSNEETFFLDYLRRNEQSTKNCNDLHVYYHILRSHFLEAFESHDRNLPNRSENAGLVGKENAVSRDKLMQNLKKILPDINRNLLSVCRKEQNSVWKQVNKPTPLSLFVHNSKENVQYKSTLINAVLAKARQTFNESHVENLLKTKLESEDIPFLRTPTAKRSVKRSYAAIVTPKIIQVEDDKANHAVTAAHDEDALLEPTPSKRLRLSPRNTKISPSVSASPIHTTPIVKRRTHKKETDMERGKTKVCTPHSILKVKNLTNKVEKSQKKSDLFKDDFDSFEKTGYTPITTPQQGSSLSLTPRKSLTSRTATPTVRFEETSTSSRRESLRARTPQKTKDDDHDNVVDQSLTASNKKNYSDTASATVVDGASTSLNQTGSSNSKSAEFYSADEEEDIGAAPSEDDQNDDRTTERERTRDEDGSTIDLSGVMTSPAAPPSFHHQSVVSSSVLNISVTTTTTTVTTLAEEEEEEDKLVESVVSAPSTASTSGPPGLSDSTSSGSPVFSPKARRSYKKLSQSPTRSSPRKLARNQTPSASTVIEEAPEEDTPPGKPDLSTREKTDNDSLSTTKNDIIPSPSPKIIPALRGRKSLCRQVLEHNALTRVLQQNTPTRMTSVPDRVKPDDSLHRSISLVDEEVVVEKSTDVGIITKYEERSEEVITSQAKYSDGEELQRSTSSVVHKYSFTTTLTDGDDITSESDFDSSIEGVCNNQSLIYPQNRSKSMQDSINDFTMTSSLGSSFNRDDSVQVSAEDSDLNISKSLGESDDVNRTDRGTSATTAEIIEEPAKRTDISTRQSTEEFSVVVIEPSEIEKDPRSHTLSSLQETNDDQGHISVSTDVDSLKTTTDDVITQQQISTGLIAGEISTPNDSVIFAQTSLLVAAEAQDKSADTATAESTRVNENDDEAMDVDLSYEDFTAPHDENSSDTDLRLQLSVSPGKPTDEEKDEETCNTDQQQQLTHDDVISDPLAPPSSVFAGATAEECYGDLDDQEGGVASENVGEDQLQEQELDYDEELFYGEMNASINELDKPILDNSDDINTTEALEPEASVQKPREGTNEVIEINSSSSEDEHHNAGESSSSSSTSSRSLNDSSEESFSRDENRPARGLFTTFEGNYSLECNVDGEKSNDSVSSSGENSDRSDLANETTKSEGLFHGVILVPETSSSNSSQNSNDSAAGNKNKQYREDPVLFEQMVQTIQLEVESKKNSETKSSASSSESCTDKEPASTGLDESTLTKGKDSVEEESTVTNNVTIKEQPQISEHGNEGITQTSVESQDVDETLPGNNHEKSDEITDSTDKCQDATEGVVAQEESPSDCQTTEQEMTESVVLVSDKSQKLNDTKSATELSSLCDVTANSGKERQQDGDVPMQEDESDDLLNTATLDPVSGDSVFIDDPSVSKGDSKTVVVDVPSGSLSLETEKTEEQSIVKETAAVEKQEEEQTTSSKALSPGRRITRRSLSLTTTSNEATLIDQSKSSDTDRPKLTATKGRPLRTRCQSTDTVESPDNTSMPVRRTRSASLDLSPNIQEVLETSKSDISLTSQQDANPRKRTRAASISKNLPKIDEQQPLNLQKPDEASQGSDKNVRKTKKIPVKKSKSTIVEDYSMARRVTRRQVDILQKKANSDRGGLAKMIVTSTSEDLRTMDEDKEGDHHVDMEMLDPIGLLDITPFEGKPDPEEKKVYETSSNSDSGSPIKDAKRRLRSASFASDVSGDSNVSKTSKNQEMTPSDSAVKRSGPLKRPRKKSTDEASNVSSVSTRTSASRTGKSNKLSTSKDQETTPVTRSTRSRSKSVSSVVSEKSAVSSTSKTRRSKQVVASASTLPEIKEETDESESTTTRKRGAASTRKKSSKV